MPTTGEQVFSYRDLQGAFPIQAVTVHSQLQQCGPLGADLWVLGALGIVYTW